MITKMKKLTFLVYYKEYEAFLNGVRGLKRLQQLFRSLQAGRQTDTVLQLRIVGNALLLFGHMHHTEVAQKIMKSHQEKRKEAEA